MIRVLVVDDEGFVRRGILEETDWRSLGCEPVGEACDGRDGLEKAHTLRPDLIISDIRMPGLSGIEMLRRLRQEGNPVRLIFLTAYSEFEYAREALKLYAFDYLLKPFEDGELEAVVQRVRREIEAEKGVGETVFSFIPELPPEKELSRNTRETLRYIAGHYGERELSVGMLAEALEISEGHLSHLFKRETGVTVMGYLTAYRIQRAAELLLDSHNRVYEIAERVGYRDIAYFSNSFKRLVGKTPSEWQNR